MSDAPQDQYGQGPVHTGPAGDQHAPTEWIGSGDPPGAGPPPTGSGSGPGRGRGRLIIVGALAAVLAVVAGGVVLAFQTLNGGGAQPAEALPADVLGYVRIDLDPSAEQKINAVQLLRRVPEFEEQTGITSDTDDLRKRLYEEGLDSTQDCPPYETGVEPWIGDRAGFGAMPTSAGEDPDPIAVVQVTDEEAAKPGIEAFAACTDEDVPGIAFVGEYALVAETQELADRFAADAEEAPLSDDAEYQADMAALEDEGIVSAWVDVEAILDSYATEDEAAEAARAGLDDVGSMSMALRAGSDNLELAMAVEGLPVADLSAVEAVGLLPESTMVALGFTGGADSVDLLWERAGDALDTDNPGTLGEMAATVEQQTGLVLPDDLRTLFGEDFALALDSDGVAVDEATGGLDPSSVRFGLRTSSDAAVVGDLVGRIETAAAPFLAIDLAEREIEGGAVVATSEDYADVLATEGGLGDSGSYQSAVANADDAVAVAFVDLDKLSTVVDRIATQTGDSMSGQEKEILDLLRAFGMSATVDGDYASLTFRVVFD